MSRVLSFLINEPPLTVSPSLARALGINAALLIQQMHYWLEHKRRDPGTYSCEPHFFDGHHWIFWTYAEMLEQVPVGRSIDPLKLAVGRLKSAGILITTNNPRDRWDKRTFYRIDYIRLASHFDENYSQADSKSLILPMRGNPSDREVGKPLIDDGESRCSMSGKASDRREGIPLLDEWESHCSLDRENDRDNNRENDRDVPPSSFFEEKHISTAPGGVGSSAGQCIVEPLDLAARFFMRAQSDPGCTPAQIVAALDGATPEQAELAGAAWADQHHGARNPAALAIRLCQLASRGELRDPAPRPPVPPAAASPSPPPRKLRPSQLAAPATVNAARAAMPWRSRSADSQ